jgi:hypothetical protein
MRNNKDNQSYTTQIFKWFGLTSLHPLAEMTCKKIHYQKMEYKNNREKIIQIPKPQSTQISLSHKRDYSQNRIQKTNIQTLLLLKQMAANLYFLSHSAAPFLLITCFWLPQKHQEENTTLGFSNSLVLAALVLS